MKMIYLLPNIFTLGNIFFGFFSMISSIEGEFVRAAYVIIVAGFFDVFDGKVARATNSTSRFGVEFDSLADLVSFGIAPAILVYLWALQPAERVGWLGAFLFVVCGALRLARFNVLVDVVSSDRFIGLPIPCAAGMVASAVILVENFPNALELREHWLPLITAMVYGLAVLMVSNIQYRSTKKMTMKGKNPFGIMVIAALFLIVIALNPEISFFAIGVTYIAFGLIEAVFGLRKLLTKEKPPTKSA